MTEREIGTSRERELFNNSITLTSLTEAFGHGLTQDDVSLLCEEVSHSIGEYNHGHDLEMLPKSAETIYNQFSNNLSCLIVSKDDVENRWRFLYHGSIYPVFEKGEEKILGTQIVEFGSAITQLDFRQSFGLGSQGVDIRLRMMRKLATKDVEVFGISTVKRLVTGHAWRKFDVHPVSFWKHPYTSFLTNTCEKSSERFGHESCQFRRPIEESTDEVLKNLFIKTKDNPYIPCTLIASNHDVLERFEAKCRDLNKEIGGLPLFENDISVNSYKRAQDFFDRITAIAIQKD